MIEPVRVLNSSRNQMLMWGGTDLAFDVLNAFMKTPMYEGVKHCESNYEDGGWWIIVVDANDQEVRYQVWGDSEKLTKKWPYAAVYEPNDDRPEEILGIVDTHDEAVALIEKRFELQPGDLDYHGKVKYTTDTQYGTDDGKFFYVRLLAEDPNFEFRRIDLPSPHQG